jgi:phosphatidylglycerophosphate synthase
LPALLPALVSLLRPALGLYVLSRRAPAGSALPLSIVLFACATDFFDGRIARGIGGESLTGRLVDNLCDFGFLLCMLVFCAQAELWSPPVWGSLLRHWAGVNRLPVYALAGSFGTYLARLLIDRRAGREPQGSPRGHAAGVANYGLAILGAVEMLPQVELGPRLLESAMLAVVLLNAAAVVENVLLMFHPQRGGPRMQA